MRRLRRLAAVVAAFGIPAAAQAAPLEVYGGLPSLEQVTISPNGQMLAYAVTDGEQRRIMVQQLAPTKLIAAIRAGDQKLRDLRWAGDGHVILTTSVTGYIPEVESARLESRMATDYDLVAHSQKPLLGAAPIGSGENLTSIEGVPDVRMIDGKPFAFVVGTEFVGGSGQPALFKISLSSPTGTLEAQGRLNTQGFVVGATAVLAEDDYDGAGGGWTLRAKDGVAWRGVAHETALDEAPELAGPGRGPDTIIVRYVVNHEPALKELDLHGAPTGGELPLPDADRLWYDASGVKLVALSGLYGDEERYAFIDPHDQKEWAVTVAAFPGQRVSLVDYDAARDKFVVLVDSPTDGPAYALVDLTTHHASWIGPAYKDLNDVDVSPVRAITFKAKDGLEISGYLTTPNGKSEKGLPLVVLVHGGPQDRDEPGFDWWSQALASRGYAVLRVNYRGSGGLGWDTLAAGFGQWGRKMQTDLSDGVRYLAAQGVVDPARVCVAGASYGGYAALAGATLDTGVYRCAASVSGPSDLAKMVNWDKSRETDSGAASTQRYWTRYMGAPSTLDDISPAKHADRVTIPILLIHGKDDTVVDYQQSQIMAAALAKAGKPYEFVTLKAEDHWLSRGATRLEMLQAMVAFLEKNNPPG